VFAAASFLNDLGAYMVYSLWPIFVTAVIGADMAVLGLIDGLGDALVSLSQAASGYASDRLKRRKVFIWLGYLFGGLSRAGYAVSKTWQHLLVFRVFDRAGKMRDAPRDAIVADASRHGNRGKNFGYLQTLDRLGAVSGIIASILLFPLLGYQNLFLLAALPSLAGAALVFILIRERKQAKLRIYKGISFKNIDANLKLFLGLSAIFALASFSYSFLLVYANRFGFQAASIPVLFLLFNIIASLSSVPFGKLADKIGRKTVLAMSFALWGATCAIFIISQSMLAIIAAFIAYGLNQGAFLPVQKAFVSELAPKRFRASVLGGYQMVVGLCALPSSVLAGLLWDSAGMFAPLYFSLALTVIAAALLLFVKEK